MDETISEADRKAFDLAMEDVYTKALKECGYKASYYRRMLTDYGALGTAQMLIGATQPSDGFTALWELKRLDLTVEYSHSMPDGALCLPRPNWPLPVNVCSTTECRSLISHPDATPGSEGVQVLNFTSAALQVFRLTIAVPLLLIGSALGLVALFFFFYAAIFIYVVAVSGDHGLMDEAYIRHNALWLISGTFLAGLAAGAVCAAMFAVGVRILSHRPNPKLLPSATDPP